MKNRKSFRLNPFLWALYHLLRFLSWIGFRFFFKRVAVINRAQLYHLDGPVIIVVNHPSTLMDVFSSGTHIPRAMFFLANYGLFKNPVSNWLLRRLYCIPVKRKEDVQEGEQRNNDMAFEQSFQHLERGGTLFIAPEGTSWMNRFIRPLKTGTARIALGAEGRNEGKMGLRIVPIGLTYNAPHLFRSDVVVNVGSPIEARDWLDNWQKNPAEAVDALTQTLEEKLKELSIHTGDEAGEVMLTRLETMLHQSHPLSLREEFARSQRLVKNILPDPAAREKVDRYFAALEQAGISDEGINGTYRFLDKILLYLMAPLFLLGMVFWFLPLRIPYWVNKKLDLYIGYSSTIKTMVGLFVTFPLAITGLWFLGRPWFYAPWHFPAVLVCILLLGLFCEEYLAIFQRHTAAARVSKLRADERAVLRRLRMEITVGC